MSAAPKSLYLRRIRILHDVATPIGVLLGGLVGGSTCVTNFCRGGGG